MATLRKTTLSGSTNGIPLVVNTTASSALTLVHTAASSSAVLHEIWLYAHNKLTANTTLNLFLGSTASINNLTLEIAPRYGNQLVLEGYTIAGQAVNPTIQAWVSTSDVVGLTGFVNVIDQS